MALWQNSDQPGSKPEQKDNRMEISRNFAQQRRGQNHEEKEIQDKKLLNFPRQKVAQVRGSGNSKKAEKQRKT
ncbi:hypothetical protein L6164_025919 [Bauhinia variegata]|uniref:Uncharacterized protein n=1 Tax=Bauhinia variegata TaxID=167791 RepID=A0ACB9M2D7_BAUVA|nr:hypothetical protein L6164_025919 [Bauhinia variegata]